MLEHLRKLGDHIANMDNGSKDAAAIKWAVERLIATKTAADAILAPMTAEFGRIMEEAPNELIDMTLCSQDAAVPAGKFMALYHATDF
ncbi:MAG TPA: hypothetical protein VF443_10255 [Nitrospira sp.]